MKQQIPRCARDDKGKETPLAYVLYGQVLVPVQMAGVVLIVLGTLGVNLKGQWRCRALAQA